MLYISPPFGNYISLPDTKSICGTFTWEKRKGIIYHTLRSLRPVYGGWRNQIGFRNWGIRNVTFSSDNVYSIGAIHDEEWEMLLTYLPSYLTLELNLGCPNVAHRPISRDTLRGFLNKFGKKYIHVKVSPESPLNFIEQLLEDGVSTIHLSNTLGTDSRGGISGKQLRLVNLPFVSKVRKLSSGIRIVAGGGIYSKNHLIQYHDMGATDYSIATIFLSRPCNIPSIVKTSRACSWPMTKEVWR